MRRRLSLTLDAPPEAVRTAFDALPPPDLEHGIELSADVVSNGSGTTLELTASTDIRIPYFGWFFDGVLKHELSRRLDWASTWVRARLDGGTEPDPYRSSRLLPPDNYSDEQIRQVATICAITALANFGGALFGQFGAPVAESFAMSDASLGAGLAVTRLGVLVAVIATALADRQGRRRLALWCFTGVAIANGLSALAPSFALFVAPQLLTRALTTGALMVLGIAAIEQAPEKARAYTLALLGLAGGAGFAVTVLLLPIADFGSHAWRIPFLVSAATLLAVRPLSRSLVETSRYRALVSRDAPRGRVREIVDRTYRWRFAAMGAVAFLTNVFSAPAAQLTNRYLIEEREFSNLTVALFRGVTSGLPGLLGIVLAGYLAERRGRRPLAVVALILATVFQMGVFLGEGEIIWFAASVSIVAAASAGLAFSTYGGELFPTEVRGTSNAGLVVFGVAGAIVGLLLATNLDSVIGTSLGGSMAWLGFAPLACAVFVVPWLPETKDDLLEEVSPSEV